mmetsp:Transcript_21317/g.44251  ORF Transcript_21317/g.44251 Transcript_21317/m.44251 type:complete len:496 (+) Transcript_21317:3-1490(+)
MESSVLAANAFDTDRVPPGFSEPPKVAVVLPSAKYIEMMNGQTERSFHYHLLSEPTYNLQNPFSLDADKFVDEVLAYCRQAKVDAVFAFDCFPAMLAAIVRNALQLPGPSSWSVFLCCNKYYMRREISPNFGPISVIPNSPESYPAVLKAADTQFYVGTRICQTEADWQTALEDAKKGLLATGFADRQQFYFKWGSQLGWPTGWSCPEDVVLAHSEPHIKGKGEYQAEVVVLVDGELVMADTGDIEKAPGTDAITLFKTPGTFMLTPALKAWLHAVAGQLAKCGYKSGAMDIEFMRLDRDVEAYELVEVNSRYSYMGNYLHFGLDAHAQSSSRHTERHQMMEVRNLLNRTRLSLGACPQTLPSRDMPHVAKLAAMLYTSNIGPLNGIFDSDVLSALIGNGTLDAFAPKPVYVNGAVTDYDLRQYGGWAKIGCLLMTWEDKQDDVNAKLDTVIKQLFRGKDSGYLQVRVVDEDGPGPTGLSPDALESRRKKCCIIS